MNSKEWAKREGVHPVTAYRWFREGKLPVPARRVGGHILVEQSAEPVPAETVLVYAGVSSADQKADLDRQVARVAETLTSLCARSHGRHAAANRAVRAVSAATTEVPP